MEAGMEAILEMVKRSEIISLLHNEMVRHEQLRKTRELYPSAVDNAPPPWVRMQCDIPKAVRKVKTYEEILEIKKQIYLEAVAQIEKEKENDIT
jgi:hypothetical protein